MIGSSGLLLGYLATHGPEHLAGTARALRPDVGFLTA
jgi:hypothetical protein